MVPISFKIHKIIKVENLSFTKVPWSHLFLFNFKKTNFKKKLINKNFKIEQYNKYHATSNENAGVVN